MKTERRSTHTRKIRRLPAPPAQTDDWVNDLGWLSRGPADRADREAAEVLAPLLLRDDEPSGLPPDPQEPPKLPGPPPQEPDDEFRGGQGQESKYR